MQAHSSVPQCLPVVLVHAVRTYVRTYYAPVPVCSLASLFLVSIPLALGREELCVALRCVALRCPTPPWLFLCTHPSSIMHVAVAVLVDG
jgi:hypothetical protein